MRPIFPPRLASTGRTNAAQQSSVSFYDKTYIVNAYFVANGATSGRGVSRLISNLWRRSGSLRKIVVACPFSRAVLRIRALERQPWNQAMRLANFLAAPEIGGEQVVQVHYEEGVANRVDTKPCVSVREGRPETSAGVRIGQPLSRDIALPHLDSVGVRDNYQCRGGASLRAPVWSGVVEDPGMCVSSLYSGNREVSCSAGRLRRRAGPYRSRRRGAVADDERTREVTLRHSSCDADEQSGAIRRGAGGAKGGDRGKRETGDTLRTPSRKVASHDLDSVRDGSIGQKIDLTRRAITVTTRGRNRMPELGTTDLCGGRSAMSVPTAILRLARLHVRCCTGRLADHHRRNSQSYGISRNH